MNNIILLAIASFTIAYCQGQESDGGNGFSLSYSTNNVIAIDVLAREGKNRIHFGLGGQLSELKFESKRKPSNIDQLTVEKKDDFFWVIDMGFSRIFMKKLTIHPEFSIGGRKEFTNFKEYKYTSYITSSKAIVGVGLNIGFLTKSGFEPFVGLHTLKKINVGVRISY